MFFGAWLVYPVIIELCMRWLVSTKLQSYQLHVAPHQLPLVYCPSYNITAGGIEKLHPFDSRKYGRGGV